MSDSTTFAVQSTAISTPSPVLQLSYEHVSSPSASSVVPASAASPTETCAPSPPQNSSTSSASSPPPSTSTSLSAEEQQRLDALLAAQGDCGVREFFVKKYETDSVRNWDIFYKRNADRFYKDRHYLTNEFKELSDILDADRRARGEKVEDRGDSIVTEEEAEAAAEDEENESSNGGNGKAANAAGAASASSSPPAPLLPITEPTAVAGATQRRLLEVGCGVGNAMFPLLRLHPDCFFYGIDCSKNAIQVVQNHPDYTSSARSAAWVCDIVTQDFPAPLRENHLDFATLIFVLSAIHPDKMEGVLTKVHKALKRNEGVLFLRDYAMYDLAQLRFAKTSKLGSKWYVRCDGTRSYFFTLEEICSLLQKVGFHIVEASCVKKVVRNRKEQSEMHRRFVQIRARAVESPTNP